MQYTREMMKEKGEYELNTIVRDKLCIGRITKRFNKVYQVHRKENNSVCITRDDRTDSK